MVAHYKEKDENQSGEESGDQQDDSEGEEEDSEGEENLAEEYGSDLESGEMLG